MGPLRLWPGGVTISRAIGDIDVGDALSCTPDVYMITVPTEGKDGSPPPPARLVLASDGLWDFIDPVQACNLVQRAVRPRPRNGLPRGDACHVPTLGSLSLEVLVGCPPGERARGQVPQFPRALVLQERSQG